MEIQKQLRFANSDLSNRGLKLSSKWITEQLIGLKIAEDQDMQQPTQTQENSFSSKGGREQNQDSDSFLLAKALFDCAEYRRAADALEQEVCPARRLRRRAPVQLHTKGTLREGMKRVLPPKDRECPTHQKALFLWGYAAFLAGEKQKEEEALELADPLERCKVANLNLRLLHDTLAPLAQAECLDGFNLYMLGVVLKEMKALAPTEGPKLNGYGVLCQAVQRMPWNWAAWLDLAQICVEKDLIPEELEGTVPDYMFQFFKQHLFIEQQQSHLALQILEKLAETFPNSSYVKTQTALAHYNMREIDLAHEGFIASVTADPYRLEQLDTYSDLLYVKDCKAELSKLAHDVVRIDKYRPETCCIIGNYYALKGQHEKAVVYFQRALKLDRSCLSAWTLMGHEFIELRNTEAAVEAYRRAVDINPKDYRAWYGLGQAYELLQMFLYATHYYSNAVSLRPYDSRMWCALGSCYEKLGRSAEAIRCYERAAANQDREGLATTKLARLYRQDGQMDKAAKCYEDRLERQHNQLMEAVRDQKGECIDAILPLVHGAQLSPEDADALIFLTSYYKRLGNLAEARQRAVCLLEYPGPEKEEARALLREINNLQQQQADEPSSQNMSVSMSASEDNGDNSFNFSP